MDDAFWNITLSTPSQDSGLDEEPRRSKDQQKDPINTFKAFRHIFNEEIENPGETKNRKQQRRKSREEDFLDIYADWASSVLDDERIEKKRSKRGRVPAAKNRHPVRILFFKKKIRTHLSLQLVGQTSQGMVRRPGTPTVDVKKVFNLSTFVDILC